MINFVIFSSKSFMPRTQVCIDSIRQFYRLDEAIIHLTVWEKDETQPGTYVEGMARARLEKCKELLDQGLHHIVLLGADCVLYDRIDDLFRVDGDIVLVPHVLEFPKQASMFYQTGHANADIVLFRNKYAIPAIKWILSQPIVDDKTNGIFYEQTYLSALPFLNYEVGICKDYSINVAYFNLHEPNRFPYPSLVQYSGYLDGEPDKISKYYNGPVPNETVLELFRDYQKRIDQNRKFL